MNIPNKKQLLESNQFKNFYYKIIKYIHQNKSIIELHKYYNTIFNQSIIEFPKNFQFKKLNYQLEKKYHFNFIVHYIKPSVFNICSRLFLFIGFLIKPKAPFSFAFCIDFS